MRFEDFSYINVTDTIDVAQVTRITWFGLFREVVVIYRDNKRCLWKFKGSGKVVSYCLEDHFLFAEEPPETDSSKNDRLARENCLIECEKLFKIFIDKRDFSYLAQFRHRKGVKFRGVAALDSAIVYASLLDNMRLEIIEELNDLGGIN